MKITFKVVLFAAFLMGCGSSRIPLQTQTTDGSSSNKLYSGVPKTEQSKTNEKITPSYNSQDLVGEWQGIFKEPTGEKRAVFTIVRKPDGGLNAKSYNLDSRGPEPRFSDSVTFIKPNFKIVFDEGRMIYEGRVSSDGTSLLGALSLSLHDVRGRLNLTRATKETTWLTSEFMAEPLDAVKRKAVVENLAAKLVSDYVFEKTGFEMAAALLAKLESRAYDNMTEPYEFAHVLEEDLYSIANDMHLGVRFSNVPFPAPPKGPPPKDMIEFWRKMNGAIPKVEILDGNIGYMRINGLPPLAASKEAVSAAFAFLQNTDALILDNRGNGGGDPNTVAWYMSYLSDKKPYVVNEFHKRKERKVEKFKTTYLGKRSYGAKKPVFVLTSQKTFSGGEGLSYHIQAFKRGMVVGAVTGGGAHPTAMVQLVNNFYAFIPYGRAVNPITKTNWEGVGVKPDLEVPPEQALMEAQLLAVNQLLTQETDPHKRTSLDATASKLRSEIAAAKVIKK